MLVLTRKLQEQIQIGDNITITILRVKGNSVRVGIDAPREIRVVRSELPRKDQSTLPGLLSHAEPTEPTKATQCTSAVNEPTEKPQEKAEEENRAEPGRLLKPTKRLETLARLLLQAG